MRRIGWLVVGCVLVSAAGAQAGDADGPSKLEVRGAEHRLEQFEAKVEQMRGQPFKLGFTEKEALRRISDLHKRYPDDAEITALAERARLAILASKGKTQDVDPHWLAYRQNGDRLRKLFADVAATAWAAYRESALTGDKILERAFPPPDPDAERFDTYVGHKVVLDGFRYPRDEFMDSGRQYVHVGSGARGYYYVELSNRGWLGAYEALKRYRRFVDPDMPEDMDWTVVGHVTGLTLLVPEAGKKKVGSVAWGWTVEPEAIHVPGHTLAVADATLESGGRFAGEEKMDEIKAPLYSITSIPDDVSPERLVEIFATAIKERNYKLYLDCIDPDRRKTPKALSLIMYHWEWHQHRFAHFYCHITVNPATVSVIQGLDEDDALESEFLTDEDRDKLRKHAQPLVKRAELTTVAFDERGQQYGSPKPRQLKQTEKGRWYIVDYAQPF